MNQAAPPLLRLTARQRAMLAEMDIRVWDRGETSSGARSAQQSGAPPTPAQKTASKPAVTHQSLPAQATAQPVRSAPDKAVSASTTARATPQTQAPAASPAPDLTPRPAPEVIAAMDWAALQTTVTACHACALCAGRTQAVFGVGSPRADWMVVGEAPGEQEDRLGQPFVGPSGKLLDNMLAAIGVARQADLDPPPGTPPDAAAPGNEASPPSNATPSPSKLRGVYIANVLKCRPPGNRNPQPGEVACCEPYLRRQVALVQPKIILAMGRFAVQSLLQTPDPIGRLRGRVHQYQGVPVIVTYHPAYLLRALGEKAKAWQDLCLAVETAEEK
jgi:DNA polymerase